LPNKVVAAAAEDDAKAAEVIPLLAQRPTVAGKPAAYVCREFTCLAPAASVQELAERLEE
ncbi:MAG TPA: hypothetical protein VNO70_04285, partial [Blastocatellia bacterium]|nr:hypothetical protein [Blastocatellia bacterium]